MGGAASVISFDEALAILVAQARPLANETVLLTAASGRVLAAPCIAQVDAPPADISTMDGYAVRDADLASSMPLRVIGTAYPGAAFAASIEPGDCVRIFTGAPIPSGADRVVLQEDVRRDADAVTIERSPSKRYIRSRGADFRTGDVLLAKGMLLGPRALVAVAGADLAEVVVQKRPRLSILSTGDELAEPGRARDRAGSIPESASFGVAALAELWGAELHMRARLRDDVAEMKHAAMAALEGADIVVMTGGASVGEKDFAKRVFTALGTDILFSRIAIMPGKPVWFGRNGEHMVLGLPGNPSSAMVTARLFLAPLLAAMSGRDPSSALRWRTARLAAPLPAVSERETFVRARDTVEGVLPLDNQDSGLQHALAAADLLVRRAPHAAALAAGDMVEVIDF
jgi:molybdopterin molybdotransferase